jgi:hypothetical protein
MRVSRIFVPRQIHSLLTKFLFRLRKRELRTLLFSKIRFTPPFAPIAFQREVGERRNKITIGSGEPNVRHGLAGLIPRFYSSEDRAQSGPWNREFLNIRALSTHKKHGTFLYRKS